MHKVAFILLDDICLEGIVGANTPNIDRLVNEGTYYDKFVAAPNCSNFRAKVQTGLYSIRPDNYVGAIFDGNATGGLPIQPGLLAQQVANAAHIGKWHLCQHDYYEHREDCGYAYVAGSQANLPSYYDWETVEGITPKPVTKYATSYVTEHAMLAMSFGHPYVEVAYNAVHKPWERPPGSSDATREAMLEFVDHEIGYLMWAALNYGYTLIFSADNCGTHEDGGKGSLSQKAVHAPLAIWNRPAGVGFADRQVVDTTDIYATVLDLVNGWIPGQSDGKSLLASSRQTREIAFADLWHKVLKPPGTKAQFMATDGTLKVIYYKETDTYEALTWDDQPTTQNVDHLITALQTR